eukprot:TRINITY_DN2467_c0_g1_i1.p1 TRINITY_DN2467_c0_g1~~TRINITY_DN2467_c0_g1_i1.p1  ORF type:complete len:352 (-),score=65.09 TRINITY_DN2467_c0_g1_i1:370-1425(-)
MCQMCSKKTAQSLLRKVVVLQNLWRRHNVVQLFMVLLSEKCTVIQQKEAILALQMRSFCLHPNNKTLNTITSLLKANTPSIASAQKSCFIAQREAVVALQSFVHQATPTRPQVNNNTLNTITSPPLPTNTPSTAFVLSSNNNDSNWPTSMRIIEHYVEEEGKNVVAFGFLTESGCLKRFDKVKLIKGLLACVNELHEKYGQVHGALDVGCFIVERGRVKFFNDGGDLNRMGVNEFSAPEVRLGNGYKTFESETFSVCAIAYSVLYEMTPYSSLFIKSTKDLQNFNPRRFEPQHKDKFFEYLPYMRKLLRGLSYYPEDRPSLPEILEAFTDIDGLWKPWQRIKVDLIQVGKL